MHPTIFMSLLGLQSLVSHARSVPSEPSKREQDSAAGMPLEVVDCVLRRDFTGDNGASYSNEHWTDAWASCAPLASTTENTYAVSTISPHPNNKRLTHRTQLAVRDAEPDTPATTSSADTIQAPHSDRLNCMWDTIWRHRHGVPQNVCDVVWAYQSCVKPGEIILAPPELCGTIKVLGGDGLCGCTSNPQWPDDQGE